MWRLALKGALIVVHVCERYFYLARLDDGAIALRGGGRSLCGHCSAATIALGIIDTGAHSQEMPKKEEVIP
jgi:hypothetical protein